MYRSLLYGVLVALASPCLAQFNYASIDVPGAMATVARGINNSGEVVGYYQTTACSNYDLNVPNCSTEGFTFINNTYTTITVPNSTSTTVNGVNDLGDLVGFYTQADGTRHGFVWYHTGVIETVDNPGSAYTTVPMGINKTGTVVGGVWGIGATGTFAEGGWQWTNGQFSVMNPGGAVNGTCCQSVNGISNNGILEGQVFRRDYWEAWLKESTDQDFWKYKGTDSFGTAVDDSGDVAGYSTINGGWFARHIELNEISPDRESISFKAVRYPGSQSTQPFGMNDSQYIVGSYFDSAGNRHGFIGQPTF